MVTICLFAAAAGKWVFVLFLVHAALITLALRFPLVLELRHVWCASLAGAGAGAGAGVTHYSHQHEGATRRRRLHQPTRAGAAGSPCRAKLNRMVEVHFLGRAWRVPAVDDVKVRPPRYLTSRQIGRAS